MKSQWPAMRLAYVLYLYHCIAGQIIIFVIKTTFIIEIFLIHQRIYKNVFIDILHIFT